MKNTSLIGRVLVTGVTVAVAGVVAVSLWDHYMNAPWTRDARVRADIVGIAPDVSGLVSEVLVHDNAKVKAGDVLFRVDNKRFTLALRQAEAAVNARQTMLDQAKRDLERREKLVDFVSQQQTEQAKLAEMQADAGLQQAIAERDLTKLNLDRADVRASVNGVVSNFDLHPGDYVTAGKAQVALIAVDSLRVEGYFEETKLPRIHVGDHVAIKLMGQGASLAGHVESISSGIEDRERTATGLLANINPTFSWVRLAQRVPIRIAIDQMPDGTRLVAGLTATVAVTPN